MKIPREPAFWSKMRKTETYRWWLKNNAITWHGVEPDRTIEHPPLVRKVSQRGETHYKTASQ